MTVRLSSPFQSSNRDEPTRHPLQIRQLTKIRYGIPRTNFYNEFIGFFKNGNQVVFEESEAHHVTLEFDQQRKKRQITLKGLPVCIVQ